MQVKTTVITLAAVLSINLVYLIPTLDIERFLKVFFLHYNCLQA